MSDKKCVKDLLGEDLAGYKLIECYYLELKHGLMGTFPAVYNDDTDEIVLTTGYEVILEVVKMLENRPHKMGRILCLVSSDQEKPHGFSLAASDILTGKRVRILTTRILSELRVRDGRHAFRWARGLF